MRISIILFFDFHAANFQVYFAFKARYPLCAVDEESDKSLTFLILRVRRCYAPPDEIR